VVDRVYVGGPADIGGLKKGDRITLVNKRWTDTPADLLEALSTIKPNGAVQVEVERMGKTMTLELLGAAGL
jgi:S1-C subfamily serine protease